MYLAYALRLSFLCCLCGLRSKIYLNKVTRKRRSRSLLNLCFLEPKLGAVALRRSFETPTASALRTSGGVSKPTLKQTNNFFYLSKVRVCLKKSFNRLNSIALDCNTEILKRGHYPHMPRDYCDGAHQYYSLKHKTVHNGFHLAMWFNVTA